MPQGIERAGWPVRLNARVFDVYGDSRMNTCGAFKTRGLLVRRSLAGESVATRRQPGNHIGLMCYERRYRSAYQHLLGYPWQSGHSEDVDIVQHGIGIGCVPVTL